MGAARLAWPIFAGITLIVVLISIPTEFARLRTPCSGGRCQQPYLSPAGLRDLHVHGLSVELFATYFICIEILESAFCLSMAWILYRRAPRERIALLGALFLLTFSGLFSSIGSLATHGSAWQYTVDTYQLLGQVTLILFFCVFPAGRFVPGWLRWPALGWIALAVPDSFAQYTHGPDSWPAPFSALYWIGLFSVIVVSQIYRYVRISSAVQRQQAKWVVIGLVGALIGFFVLGFVNESFLQGSSSSLTGSIMGNTAYLLFNVAVPLSLVISILRYGLWEVDVIINRTLVYGALTALVVGLYILVVGYLGSLFRVGNNLGISLLATGLVTVLFQPLRDWLHHAVNRMMYGERDDPYAVLSRLGRQLEGTLAPEAALSTIVETVAQSLKLPYTAIVLQRDGAYLPAASFGTPAGEPLQFPLVYGAETVGQLLLSPRAGEAMVSSSDRRLLDDLARQAGVAVQAVNLTNALQHSRARLVTTREEERRRLRRDLHDGLGPALASVAMIVDAARNLLYHDPDAAEQLLTELKAQSQRATADIRRVVYELRPPVLDELGLISALREQAAGHERSGLQVRIEAPDQVETLPAAVEVAAYRIVLEALTNVVRHSGARNCTVSLFFGANLVVEVQDDGKGLAGQRRIGVGLNSMRERSEELGGSWFIESPADGGTRVVAHLPLTCSAVA